MRKLSVAFSVSFLLSSMVFANAPVATLNTSGSTTLVAANTDVSVDAADSDSQTPAANPTVATPQAPVPQVVDTQALLASLTPEQRIARLENQVQYLNTYTNQINSLSTQVDMLRGQVEDLTHQIAQQQKQIDSLTQQQATLSKAATDDKASSQDTAAPALPSAAEQSAYQSSYNLMAKKQYAPATQSFNAFLKKYPKSSLSDNAHYWLGDLYLAQGQPDNASKQYRAVISDQNAAKRPDAMVKLGTILLAYGDNAHAKDLFQSVIKQYPNTSAATQARKQLKSLQ